MGLFFRVGQAQDWAENSLTRQSLLAFVCSFARETVTIKFAPAVSQKELEKLLHAGEGHFNPDELKKLKAALR